MTTITLKPTHGAWCGAKTIPMTCRYCGETIFWFSCDCGCSVLFDDLGGDWPRHRCDGFMAQMDVSRSEITTEQRTRYLIGFQLAVELDDELVAKVKVRSDAPPTITSAAPQPGAIPILGIVREIVPEADGLARFRALQHSPIHAKDWSRLFSKPQAQVTLHCDEGGPSLMSYTFLADASSVSRKVRKGDLVIGSLKGEKLGLELVWKAIQLERLY